MFLAEGLWAQSASKAFELFKRNQWAVNKKLKFNDEAQKKRVDELSAIIQRQNDLIQKLSARLESLETKAADTSDKDARFFEFEHRIQLG